MKIRDPCDYILVIIKEFIKKLVWKGKWWQVTRILIPCSGL